MKIIISALFILIFCSTAFAQDIDLLWKARALKASENLKKLEKEISKNDSPRVRLEIMLETAYAAIIAMPDVTVKKTPKIIAYHIILNFGDEGILDVVYTYETKTYDYLGVRIDRLPKNRGLLLMKGIAEFFAISNLINNSEHMVIFDRSDPFRASVVQIN